MQNDIANEAVQSVISQFDANCDSGNDILRASILLVDADAKSLYEIASILVAKKHKVSTARNASVAIELAKHQSIDLIISESHVGDVRGEDIVNAIRQCPQKSDVPALFVSATQTVGVIYRNDQAGGSGFHLKKPIEQSLLLEMVEHALWLPHLVNSHVEQKVIPVPHINFARNPMAMPGATVAGFTSPTSF